MTEVVTNPNAQAALYTALARAGERCKGVEKDATNTFHRYKYASAEAIFAEAREALNAEGVSVIVQDAGVRQVMPPEGVKKRTKDGKDEPVGLDDGWVLDLSVTVVHAEGGELPTRSQWPVIPGNGRPLDKAVAGARTTALAYLVRDLLLLPRVEEGTLPDERDDRPAQENRKDYVDPRQSVRQAPPPPARPPEAPRQAVAMVPPERRAPRGGA